MASTVRVKTSVAQERLMDAIGLAVRQHTLVSPMGVDEIVSVMAFATGCAIGQGDSRRDRRLLREMAVANIDHGLDAVMGKAGNLILPN